MELSLYKSHFPDGCPLVSGTKTKFYALFSQIFWYKHTDRGFTTEAVLLYILFYLDKLLVVFYDRGNRSMGTISGITVAVIKLVYYLHKPL
jgi:hypothetical protein